MFALTNHNRSQLTESSDAQLAGLVKLGDSDAFAELMERYISLIRAKAAPFHSTHLETDDLCQEGLLGLLNAARAYNPANGASFKTFAGVCIANQIAMAYRSAASRKNEPLHDFISLNEESPLSIEDEGGDPEAVLAESENFSMMWKRIRQELSGLEFQVLKYYLAGYSYGDIAKKLTISAKVADNALYRARYKLKNRIKG